MLTNDGGFGMRQQEKIIIWPAYFDSNKTRTGGRRIPKNLAVPSPKISEVKEAADKLGLSSELIVDAGYSKVPWMRTGMILVKKKGSKEQVILSLAKQLLKMRSAQAIN
jgi:signal recognition particle subunit SRP19